VNTQSTLKLSDVLAYSTISVIEVDLCPLSIRDECWGNFSSESFQNERLHLNL
jgi:hypothetical protein